MDTPTVRLTNGIQMPQLGFGVWEVEDGAQVVGAVNEALGAGYRAIDTATIYGNEGGVGEAIRQSGIERSELFITTKLWNTDHGYDEAIAACEASLSRLGLDYVDLYLIHWPVPSDGLMADTWRAMEYLHTSGRAKAIGVSNFQPEHLSELLKTATIAPMVDQVELHPRLPQHALRAFCEQHNIVVTAWSPLFRGELLRNGTIKQLAAQYGKTPAQIVLRWHIQLGHTVIPKSVTPERIKENIDIFDFQLSNEAMSSLNQLDDGQHVFEYSREFII